MLPSEEDRSCTITQPLEIRNVLRRLHAEQTLVRLGTPDEAVSVLSTVLACDPETGTLLLDTAQEAATNARLSQAAAIQVQAAVDGVLILFSAPVHSARHEGRPAFGMYQPDRLERQQRRAFFRVEIPATQPASCQITDAWRAGGTREEASFRLLDISAGGLRLADPKQQLREQTPGTLFEHCTLDLPDIGQVPIALRLVRLTPWREETGRPLLVAAFNYHALSGNREIRIQQYISRLERAALARRWERE